MFHLNALGRVHNCMVDSRATECGRAELGHLSAFLCEWANERNHKADETCYE